VTKLGWACCLSALAACSWRAGYDDALITCGPSSRACPAGSLCSDDGLCLPADGGIIITPTVEVTFGERLTSDVSAVTFDTYLSSGNPDDNKGAKDAFYATTADTRHALLRFDLSSIGPDAAVVAASLELWTTDFATDGPLRAYPILEAWDEGNQDDAGGVANWTYRKLFVEWSGEGATPPSRGTVAVAEIEPGITQAAFTMPLPVDLVQDWVSSPASNFGLALVAVSRDGDFGFASSEAPQSLRRPELTISFVP
jgi:hypothetical protein